MTDLLDSTIQELADEPVKNGKLDFPGPERQIPTVFFFVHHFNDIDHLVPVAYKLCETGKGRPVILVTDLLDIASDYRLRFLQERYGVLVVPCFTFHPPNPLVGLLAKLLNLSSKSRQIKRVQLNLLRGLRRFFYTEEWAGKIIDRYQPASLVFESSQRTGGIFGKFFMANHKRGKPSFSLPHGLHYITNDLVNRQEQIDGYLPDRSHANMFDRVVCQSNHIAQREAKQGVLPEKLVVLGSTRFCREWQSLNFSIQPTAFKPAKEQGNRLGVSFMLPQWNYNADFDATMRTLHRLSGESWLHVVIKPQTRELDACPGYLKELQTRPNVEVAGDVGSVPMIAWSDAVVVVGSSITLEVLLQGKPHLAPTYLDENSNAFQETGAQWTVDNDEELLDALKQIHQGSSVPYTEVQVANVFRQLVLGGSCQKDVLGRYVDFVIGGWRELPTYEENPHDY